MDRPPFGIKQAPFCKKYIPASWHPDFSQEEIKYIQKHQRERIIERAFMFSVLTAVD